jgi:multidrug resistance protein, MATE family
MYPTKTKLEKSKLFLHIIFPILISQVGLYAINFFDTIMSGHAGATDLAGVAIGSSIWTPIFTGLNGILLALSPIVAQHLGAKREEEIPKAVLHAIYLAITIALLVLLIGFFFLEPFLSIMDLDSEVKYIAKYYLIALGVGIIPLFLFNTIRCFFDALGQTKVSMFIILLSLPINVIFNYLFIFGKFGFPELGGIGAGVATAISYYIIVIIAFIALIKIQPFSSYKVFQTWIRPSAKMSWEQLKIGIPMGFASFFETSIFAAVTLFMSKYDTNTIAAHQSALNFESMLYMIPLSIAMGLTICIGFEVGAKRYKDAKQYFNIGISFAVCLAILAGLIIYLFDQPIANLYSNQPEVIELTKQFLLYAIFFQLSDALGAPIQGSLRGYKDVNITSIMAFISFWVIGLPTGYLLANYTALGPFGYWIGLITGVTVGAITLLCRLLYIQRQFSKRQISKQF